MRSQLLIGAASSGSGKTTFTLGLLRALARKGLVVQPFKCGPDYIDTRHHQMAAGRASVNLDRFMMSEKHIEEVYRRYAFPADIAITEGVMGLFDGYDCMQGSSAEMASALDIPVVLIVNAKSTAYSVAPLLYGFKHFYPKVRVIGAVFNFVASENHYYYLKQACADAGVEALGYLPKQEDITIPSRHLGLSLDSDFCFEAFADRIADLVDKHVCVDRLLELASAPMSAHTEETGTGLSHRPSGTMRISVARDAAFNFVYAENIAYLEQLGNVTYFSPLTDKTLPPTDFLYLPGGYPELHLKTLSENQSMRDAVRAYLEKGGHALAECGGMMYLCRSIIGQDGNTYPMAGVLDQTATMQQMKLRLGYRTLQWGEYRLAGHEFHYSSIVPAENTLPSCATAFSALGRQVDTPLYHYRNLLAGYTHLYWADPTSNAWLHHFLEK